MNWINLKPGLLQGVVFLFLVLAITPIGFIFIFAEDNLTLDLFLQIEGLYVLPCSALLAGFFYYYQAVFKSIAVREDGLYLKIGKKEIPADDIINIQILKTRTESRGGAFTSNQLLLYTINNQQVKFTLEYDYRSYVQSEGTEALLLLVENSFIDEKGPVREQESFMSYPMRKTVRTYPKQQLLEYLKRRQRSLSSVDGYIETPPLIAVPRIPE
jgi:hypothetical protein